jgi:molybdate transport system substrate-binding protein
MSPDGRDGAGGGCSRRGFVRAALAGAAAAALPTGDARAAAFATDALQVWSCGGLSEGFAELNEAYRRRTGVRIDYTGAFAAALGKSLLGGARTDVFAGRVLDLARKLREAGTMAYFRPLCFTRYVLVTPRGNPARVRGIEDLARPGVRVVLALDASPPGGQAVQAILKNAGIAEAALRNAVVRGSCVQRTAAQLAGGEGDASVVELRIARRPELAARLEVLPIPEALFPPGPLTFTIGPMTAARDRPLADDYVAFATSPEGQAFLERAGFVPAGSDEGRALVERLGVKDV